MPLSRRAFTLGLPLSAAASGAAVASSDGILADLRGLDRFIPAVEAYVFGYPLVTMEVTRRIMTNVAAPVGTRAPMGQFVRAREYPTAAFRDVTAPNADTLYTTAWVDVGKEPWVLSLPDMKGRYFLFPMLDGWTNVFAVPGTRTTGTGAQTYAITGPGWSGTLPPGVVEYKSPTSLVWLLGRIYCSGTAADYAEVHRIQDECRLVPLSAYGRSYTPAAGQVDNAIDMRTAVRDQVNRMTATEYFGLLAGLLKTNPLAAADGAMLPTLAKVGIVPGQDFDAAGFDVDFASRVPVIAQDRIMVHLRFSGGDFQDVNGWKYTTRTGSYGTNYVQRALITMFGLGANLPQDAVYPLAQHDANGATFNGSHRYVMHFPKGTLPPVKGFWSLTMYDDNWFFVNNPINRYSVSPRNNLRANADGSVDLYIQKDSPGADKESNWLPAPPAGFLLMLRLYWPDPAAPTILDGSWKPPALVRQG